MGKTKTIEVSITSLRTTAEDPWMKKWYRTVKMSPHYLYLQGFPIPMLGWMEFRGLESSYITKKMMKVLKSLIEEGQRIPIKIYADGRINTGHKRAACMLFLGYKKIKAEIVPDDYKL